MTSCVRERERGGGLVWLTRGVINRHMAERVKTLLGFFCCTFYGTSYHSHTKKKNNHGLSVCSSSEKLLF